MMQISSGLPSLVALTLLSAAAAAAVPADSAMARLSNAQQILLSPCEAGEQVNKRSWEVLDLVVSHAAAEVPVKCGTVALNLSGDAKVTAAKGDFVFSSAVTRRPTRMVGGWVCLPADANIERVGLQMADGDGEFFIRLLPADWQGWKWLEVDLTATAAEKIEQAFPQPGKNGRFDGGLNELSVVWFAKAPGQTTLAVDGLVAAVEPDPSAGSGLQVLLGGTGAAEPGEPLAAHLRIVNLAPEQASVQVEYSAQENSTFQELIAPDPVHGSDHALGARSWTMCEGNKVEENSLTDGKDATSAATPYKVGHFSEAYQYVDLGSERRITHMRHTSGDANWYWKVDFAFSAEGSNYEPIPEFQNMDWHKKWGRYEMAVPQPFKARYLRLRYHNDGHKSDIIRMFAALSVYDGLEDESRAIPAIGKVIASGRRQVEIPPRSFALVPLVDAEPLGPGSYFVAVRVENAGRAQVTYANLFVMPPAMAKISPESRFGMNAADPNLVLMNRRLGVGWARYENLKWPFVSPKPGVYAYDGSVLPWAVRMDETLARYRSADLNILPTMFLTPPYLASEKAPSPEAALAFPPRQIELYGEFAFQTAARYGSVKHPPEALKTADKKSGMGLIKVFELWNEPDLNNMDWGSWRGPYGQYLEMFRYGAEGVKKADPSLLVSIGGLGEYKLESVDRLRTYTYKDGKTPLSFMDVLNVHHYTGVTAPELATADFNVQRTLAAKGEKTYEQELQLLSEWRNKHKPGMPIWLTETGYETAGPIQVSPRIQAAYLVRNLMLALANGVDKIFVFREAGSGSELWASSGMVRDDGSYNPVWFTYATLIRQLDGVTEGKRQLHPDANVRIYTWRKGSETVVSAWAIDGEAAIDLDLGDCTLTDAFGHTVQTTLRGKLPLSIFPLYISGLKESGLHNLYESTRRHEQARRDELARYEKIKAVLFDFGSEEQVGSVEVGVPRPCTAVLAGNLWDAGKGFGFEPKAAYQNDLMPWIPDKLESDGVRFGSDIRFRLRAQPGKYQLRLKASRLEPTLNVTISGLQGGAKTLAIEPDAIAETEVEVGGEPLVLAVDHYIVLQWLTLIEKQ